jgi:hypothetical protein
VNTTPPLYAPDPQVNIAVQLQILLCIFSHDGMTVDGVLIRYCIFIEHLQIVTTSNYSVIPNTRILKFTTASTKSSSSAVSLPVVVG